MLFVLLFEKIFREVIRSLCMVAKHDSPSLYWKCMYMHSLLFLRGTRYSILEDGENKKYNINDKRDVRWSIFSSPWRPRALRLHCSRMPLKRWILKFDLRMAPLKKRAEDVRSPPRSSLALFKFQWNWKVNIDVSYWTHQHEKCELSMPSDSKLPACEGSFQDQFVRKGY